MWCILRRKSKIYEMRLFRKNKAETADSHIPWVYLENELQLPSLLSASFEKPVVIYKHSTRCGVSSMMLNRLEREYEPQEMNASFYFLDLIRYRELSNHIADMFSVQHESPQLLLVKNGKVSWHDSHGGVSFEVLK